MKNIVLIGMSGVGKTTIGKALSIVLNRRFVDTDNLIENKKGIKIEEIFKIYGEDYFRKLECQIINELYKEENLIISTGGGIVLNSNNITMLKENGIMILLESSIDNLVNNIKNSTARRPLLNNGEEIYNNMKIMYNHRKRLYLSSADFIIFVDGKSIDEIVYEILRRCVKINS
ncbi:shikimate kinase [Tissierella sp.]|uniref:shikimate kinase n=1 Tax=Tissierella sp. TaxID=41274 RepID=UPI0028B1AF3D|nr:shikimate kinase [Tissierella sp.]